ncbi:MAG: quinolinate synthase NadA [Saprospiraceae bacterium]
MSFQEAKENLNKNGFLNLTIDKSIDIVEEIKRLKKEKNAVLLAHYYQVPAIQDLADYIGDSLGLAQQAAKTDADLILFCGVHFMAETAKMLNPDKKVLLPDLNAGCSLASSAPADIFQMFKNQYPDHLVVSYVNSSAELKTMTDICCTSSNAEIIINSIPKNKGIIFAPDKNLGAYLNKKTGRDMVLWHGVCQVHEMFSWEKIVETVNQYPGSEFIAHPECEEHVLEIADFIGSTSQLLNHVKTSKKTDFIVATEPGILYQMQKQAPGKNLYPAPPSTTCACNECPFMKMNTVEKVYLALKYEMPEIILDQNIITEGRKCIDKMLEISARAGL